MFNTIPSPVIGKVNEASLRFPTFRIEVAGSSCHKWHRYMTMSDYPGDAENARADALHIMDMLVDEIDEERIRELVPDFIPTLRVTHWSGPSPLAGTT
jgi:hypothetical protein